MWFTQHSLSSDRPVLTDFSVSKQNGGAGAGPDSTATTATSRNGARIDGKPPLRGIGMHVHRLVGNGLNLLSCIELREAPECSTTRLTRHLSGGFRVPKSAAMAPPSVPAPPTAARQNTTGLAGRKDVAGNRQESGGFRPDCMGYTVRRVMSVTSQPDE